MVFRPKLNQHSKNLFSHPKISNNQWKNNSNRGHGNWASTSSTAPLNKVVQLGHYEYKCQDDLICKVEISKVPYFNAPILLENGAVIGKVDEIFGTIQNYSVSIKLDDNIKANGFKVNQKLFIHLQKLLPLQKFLPKPITQKVPKKSSSKNIGQITKNAHQRNWKPKTGGTNYPFGNLNQTGGIQRFSSFLKSGHYNERGNCRRGGRRLH